MELKTFNEFINSSKKYKEVQTTFINFLRYFMHTGVNDKITLDMCNSLLKTNPEIIFSKLSNKFMNADELFKQTSVKDVYNIRCTEDRQASLITLSKGSTVNFKTYTSESPDLFEKSIKQYMVEEESESSEESESNQ